MESMGVSSRGAFVRGAAALASAPFVLGAANMPGAAQGSAGYAALIDAAQGEGSVVVDGPPLDLVRQALTHDFEATFGIPVSYISSGETASLGRVRAERTAGKFLLDVFVSGIDTPTTGFLPSGFLDRVEPILIAPDVVNVKDWKDRHLWYEDPQHTILRTIQYVTDELAVNTKMVNPSEVTWKSLIDPKWQGKLLVKDPSIAGAGASLISFFYLNFGPEYVQKLYKDQKPVLSRDARQMAQWLAQGNYPIVVGPDYSLIKQFKDVGYPVEAVFPSDGPLVLSGGFGLICLINKAPHPNAAKLFINWLAGREGSADLARAQVALSLRTDLDQDWAPSFEFLKPGAKFLDSYDYTFTTKQRDQAYEKVRELLGL